MFITFEIWIFFLQKRMDSLQEAFIHPTELCDARFFNGCAHFYFTSSGLLTKSTRLHHCKAWRGQDNFLYNSDWIRLKEESHIHLGCFEGE